MGFIDFGFSKFLKEKPGFKTCTTFIGTYNFVSKQMQSLFHLRNFSYIDMYSNDLHGLQLVLQYFSNRDFSLHKVFSSLDRNINQSESLFLELISFKKQVFLQNYVMIQKLFLKQIRLRKFFLLLIIDSLESQNILKNSYLKNEKLRFLYQRYSNSKLSQEEKKNLNNFEQNFENKHFLFIFNHIKGQQNDEEIKFCDKNEQQIKVSLSQNWGKLQFTKELFNFIDLTFFEKGQKFERLKTIVEIISNTILSLPKQKDWFMSLRNLFLKIQQIFSANSYFLPQFNFYYQIFNDFESLQRISEESQYTKIPEKKLIFFLKFMECATNEPSLKRLNHYFNEYLNAELDPKKQLLDLIQKVMVFILKAIQKNEIEMDDQKQMGQLISQLCKKQIYKSYDGILFLLEKIKLWEKKFTISKVKTSKIGCSAFRSILKCQPNSQYFKFYQIVEKFKKKSYHSDNLRVFNELQAEFPILEELPQLFNFEKQIRKKKFQKANQIANNIIRLRCKCLQVITQQLFIMSKKQESVQMKNKYIISIIDEFLLSYTYKIEKRSLKKYWFFFFRSISFLCDLGGRLEKNLEEKIRNSIRFIISFFYSLQMHSKFYIYLLQSLLKFLEGKLNQAISSIYEVHKKENFENQSSIDEQYILCLTFYFRQTTLDHRMRQQFFCNLQKRKNINWVFYSISEVFREYIRRKSSQIQVYEALKKFTQYLYSFSSHGKMIGVIFKEHIQKSVYQQLQKLGTKIVKFEKLKTIRENNHISAFIGFLFLKLIKRTSLKLFESDFRRLLILSLISIDKFLDEDRIEICKKLISEMGILNRYNITYRKKLILCKRISYSRSGLTIFQEKVFFNLKAVSREKILKKMKKKFHSITKSLKTIK